MFVDRTDEPAADYDRYCTEQERLLAKLPECSKCGEKVQDDFYRIDGEVFCEHCIEDFKERIDAYL